LFPNYCSDFFFLLADACSLQLYSKVQFLYQSLRMHLFNSAFSVLDSVDSTNNYAMAKVHAGLARHGDGWYAKEQTAGKGQRGKKWHTGEGDNIAMSIVIEPSPLLISEQFKLSAAVALACFDFFNGYAGADTKIKWPNDIYWRDRKAGGILIENIIGKPGKEKTNSRSKWKYAIAGIGVNINEAGFDQSISSAVSLKQITGKNFQPIELAKELQQKVLVRIDALFNNPFEKILDEYNINLYKMNQPVRLKKNSIEFETIIKGVTATGQLFTTDRVDNFFDFGEVEWVL
jgi:BirA family transcriptional regulator, biotin operon repressor / biotin---[acetyl-CoA-carboxylase] ligase